MDTVEKKFYSKTWTIYMPIQYNIFKHDLNMLHVKLKVLLSIL